MADSTRQPDWYVNRDARGWTAPPVPGDVRDVHRALPGYAPTPLADVPDLATELGVGRVLVKDESWRLGLPAFKVLGASYAVTRALSARVGADSALPIDELRSRLEGDPVRLVAATDGNHGRAVARMAALLGLPATIVLPAGVSDAAREAITGEGAKVRDTGASYDDAVAEAARLAQTGADAILIQDTSWPGYEEVPAWIADGYSTLVAEIDEQLGGVRPDLVVVPTGVGSLAQAVVAHARSGPEGPAVLVVEPDTAASVLSSLLAGERLVVDTATTVMTGMNCGSVSGLAWPVLRDGLDAAVTVTDRQALDAVGRMRTAGLDIGPCGASTLAAVRAVVADPERREALGLGPEAVVVLLGTEGNAANPKAETA